MYKSGLKRWEVDESGAIAPLQSAVTVETCAKTGHNEGHVLH